jgi:[NiFe] hydrogenase assembly HybE family chaperone
VRAAGENPAADVESAFSRIAATSMADLPLNNSALRVEAVGFHSWQGLWLGVIVTPWAINLMLLPGDSTVLNALALGQRQTWSFPSGSYQFMGGSDDALGPYQFCSLFSPTFEFVTQEDARATALAAIAALFEADTKTDTSADELRLQGRSIADVPLSRRNFLRGGVFGKRE